MKRYVCACVVSGPLAGEIFAFNHQHTRQRRSSVPLEGVIRLHTHTRKKETRYVRRALRCTQDTHYQTRAACAGTKCGWCARGSGIATHVNHFATSAATATRRRSKRLCRRREHAIMRRRGRARNKDVTFVAVEKRHALCAERPADDGYALAHRAWNVILFICVKRVLRALLRLLLLALCENVHIKSSYFQRGF